MTNNQIDIEIKIDENCKIPKLVIYTEQVTEDLMKIVNKLKSADEEKLIGFKDDEAFLLNFSKIETIYTENKKIYERADNIAYQIKNAIIAIRKDDSKNIIVEELM